MILYLPILSFHKGFKSPFNGIPISGSKSNCLILVLDF